jgi:hypothetical protein
VPPKKARSNGSTIGGAPRDGVDRRCGEGRFSELAVIASFPLT